MVRGVEEKLIMSSVVPNLVRLARDTETYAQLSLTHSLSLSLLLLTHCLCHSSNVRIETISSFGIIMQAVTSKDVSHIIQNADVHILCNYMCCLV